MKNKTIIITGGPGTGKSSVIKKLESAGHQCLHEVSREIILQAKAEGIDQLFLKDPVLFSEMLLDARVKQFKVAQNQQGNLFLDRGIPDVVAYMEYIKTPYPPKFTKACESYKYDHIFILPPWKEIYQNDNERYESFDQALEIHEYLKNTYLNFGYTPIEVPKGLIGERCDFILSNLEA